MKPRCYIHVGIMQLWSSLLIQLVSLSAHRGTLCLAATLRGRGLSNDDSASRACSDAEVEAYMFWKSYGLFEDWIEKVPRPDCTPAKPPLALTRLKSPRNASAALSSTSGNPYFVQLSVVKVEAEWCAPPCQDLTWEKAAKKPAKDDANYQLLELCIWAAEHRLVLYRFDQEWEKLADNAYHGLCAGKGWGCPQVAVHRESAKLWEATWDRSLDDSALSKWLGEQLVVVLRDQVFSRQAEHYGLAYSGHGSRADGSLFEGVVHRDDATAALQAANVESSKFAIMNFGGNCVEGRWNMLAAMGPFANLIIASDLPVQGVSPKDNGRLKQYMKLHKRYDALSYMHELLQQRLAPEDIARSLLKGRQQMWEFCKAEVESQALRQSVSVFAMNNFGTFRQQLQSAWATGDRHGAILATEATACDLRAFSRALGGEAADAAFLALRTDYVSTANIFTWKKLTEGLGFNFLGWKGPPCDIAPALGGPSGTKVCKPTPQPFDAGHGGCETYAQGGPNYEDCAYHRMGELMPQEACPECGVCMPASEVAAKQAALLSMSVVRA
eukprot:TRINITY_DN81956_c0_g1_i1.p1 TRINITY_DN81956_c0_g1~~TRINITY_DN81956_c0_g1_i1.p1  ORF type:complete len:555 (+),score=62.86 TRINITY_DN81956_c0_g1_i1:98-1762(+)